MRDRVERALRIAKKTSKPVRKWWRKEGRFLFAKPIRTGDLERTTPFSDEFGADRGGAIDRLYIERFLDEKRALVRGVALEIGDDSYARAFGGSALERCDIFHVDDTNPRATYVGDLVDAPQIPSDTYDCLVLTQTFQLVWDVPAALATCHRILKPGGTLIVTVPGITQIDRGAWSASWYWSFTDRSVRRLLDERFGAANVEVRTYGNVYAASTFLYALGAREIRRELLEPTDDRYQVIVAATARKAG